MAIDDRTARRVEAELERLEADHGSFEIHETRWEVPRERYERVRDRAEAGTVGAAGVWLTNDAGEVLLVSDADREGWAEPAGKQKPDESLEETAVRETREESNVVCSIDGVALAHVLKIVPEDETAPPITRLVVAFDGRYRSGTPRPSDDDIDTIKYCLFCDINEKTSTNARP